jgi:hypothetical protein
MVEEPLPRACRLWAGELWQPGGPARSASLRSLISRLDWRAGGQGKPAATANIADRHVRLEDTGRRRRWADEAKVGIVEESLSGPRLASATARRHGISNQLLFRGARRIARDDVARRLDLYRR